MKDYTVNLFEICSAIHGDATGTGDSLPRDRLAAYREKLLSRLANWDGSQNRLPYDEAVRELVLAAINEATASLDSRGAA